MKWQDIKSLGFLGFSASWDISKSHKEVARRIINFLEDRRVLYSEYLPKASNHCVGSVLLIRKTLMEEISSLNDSSELTSILKSMTASCRKFLDTIQVTQDKKGGFLFKETNIHIFNGALGELRGSFGLKIAMLAANFELDISDDLASIVTN